MLSLRSSPLFHSSPLLKVQPALPHLPSSLGCTSHRPALNECRTSLAGDPPPLIPPPCPMSAYKEGNREERGAEFGGRSQKGWFRELWNNKVDTGGKLTIILCKSRVERKRGGLEIE